MIKLFVFSTLLYFLFTPNQKDKNAEYVEANNGCLMKLNSQYYFRGGLDCNQYKQELNK